MDQKKGQNTVLLAQASAVPVLSVYLEMNHLKELYRAGWLRKGIPPELCESVADHILGVAMLAWWVCEEYFPTLDGGKALRLALIHDLGEIHTGDLTPADAVPSHEKHRLERECVKQVLGKMKKAEEYLELWDEYESGQSEEARLVKELDRLEMAFQALVYERNGQESLEEFFQSVNETIRIDEFRHLLETVKRLR
jgi:putative hydrolases of HD superfamily